MHINGIETGLDDFVIYINFDKYQLNRSRLACIVKFGERIDYIS